MNLRRKFLQTLDLRVNQYRAGQRSTSSYRLGRLHSIESLASDHSDFKTFPSTEKTTENASF